MKKIYYEKQGRRYVPVAEYDSELHDSFPYGHHLVSVRPGSISRRFSIDPTLAPMIAAGLYAEDAIVRAIHEASKLRPAKTSLTDEQRAAWRNLIASLGEEATMLTGAAPFDIAQAGIQVMRKEADKMMTNDAVRKAYEHFLLMCKLAKERENVNT
jgi:DNA-binding MarR family transcriptional regulator